MHTILPIARPAIPIPGWGVTRPELSALITHLAFCAGFPVAISASAIAQATLGDQGRA